MPSKSKLNMIHQSGATDGQIVKYDSSANEWIPANETGGGGGTSDHGTLTGLADNDHPQYVLSSTNLALSSLVTTNQGIVEDVSSTLFDNSSSWGAGTSDHGTLTGLADDDHPQYVLSATNLTLSSLVTTNQGLVEGVSSTVFDNSSTWSTDTNTTDHTALSNIGSNTHTDIDSHIADSTLHFTEASIDHGSIGGLGDNDHPQYTLSSTNLALSSLVTTNQGLSEGVSSTVFDNSSTWATDTNTTDHGAFTGLADDDHPQYVLSATNLTLSSLVTTNQGLTEAVSSTVFDNSGSWSEGDYLPLSGGDVTGGVTISRDVDTNTGNVLTLNTDVDSSLAGPVLSLDRDSDSPADGDYLGQIKFKGKNSTGGEVTYSKVTAKTSDVTNSTEDGLLEFANQKDGSQTIVARLTSTDLKLINGTGLEVDGDVSVTGTGPWTTVSSTVFDNSSTWSIDTNTTDHGAFTGLADDDHPQYTLSATNLALSSLVTTNQGLSEGVSSTVFDNSASWGSAGAVMESDFTPAHGLLVQQSGTGSPTMVSLGTNEILGRLSSGGTQIEGLSDSDVRSLINVEDGSTANSSDATLLARGNHTGTQTTSTISDFDTEVSNNTNVAANTAKVTANEANVVSALDGASLDSATVATGDKVVIQDADDSNKIKTVTAQSIADLGSGSSDHGGLTGLSDNDHPQYTLSATNLALSSLVTTNQGLAEGVSSTVFDNSASWATDTNTTYVSSDFTHDDLTGFVADEHIDWTQAGAGTIHASNYVDNNTDTTYVSSDFDHDSLTNFVADEHIDWTVDQGSTNIHAGNYTDTNTTYVSSDFTHDDLTGFVADEHIDWTQDQGATNIHAGNYTDTNTTYVSSDFTHDDLTGFVADEHIDWTQAGAGTIHASNYVDNNTDTTYVSSDFTHDDLTGFVADEHIDWTVDQGATNIHSGNYTDTDTTDHTALSNIGSNSHTAIDSHIADSTLHFTEASIDHGSIGGLGGDDHPQYTLSATNLALSSLVTTNQGLAEGVSSTVFDNSASWGGGGGTTNLSIGTTTTTTVDVNSNTGTNATIPAAIATTAAGLLTGADKAKLDGIEAAAEVNVDTDLSKTVGASTVTIESSTGTNTEIPAVTGSLAGVLAAAQYNVILTALGRVALMEDSATADQTAAEILALLVGEKLATKSVGTDALVNKGTVTGATTIDWNDGNHQEITLGAAAITLTFTAPTQGTAMLVLNVKQDATGGRALTLPSIEYPRSGSPTYSTVADANDLHTFYWNGTTYQGGFGPAMG